MNVKVISIEDDVDLRPDSTGRSWSLLDPLVAEMEVNGKRFIVRVPKGFQTDLASVPRLLWSYIPPHGQYLRAAVVHDWFYFTAMIPRSLADKIFYRLMLHTGVGKWRARLMYAAVRIGGAGRGAWS